jgi:phosphatidylserine decarboxylase
LIGWFAKNQNVNFKNKMIHYFIHRYSVDMTQATCEHPELFRDFNSFFTRTLKPELRPITPESDAIACPVDGTVAAIGSIQKNQLLQAKNMYFSLESLLGGDIQLAEAFTHGNYATFYLSPRDYHRIHMPLTGRLKKTIYIPGKLFSVNRMTSEIIPNLYARNERVITLFDTDNAGTMAVILVGAMIVGSMQTVWMKAPILDKRIRVIPPSQEFILEKGAELGYFKMGSTVIVLFTPKRIQWDSEIRLNTSVQFGQFIGKIIQI